MSTFPKRAWTAGVLGAVIFAASCANPTAPNTTSNNSTGSGSKTNITTNTSSTTSWNYYSTLIWGSAGTGNGQFGISSSFAFDSSEKIYLADNANNRVQVFDKNGNYLSQWGSSGAGNGQFNTPVGISISSDDKVYVSDSGNRRVQVFTTGGVYLTKFGTSGTGNGQFDFTIGPGSLIVESTNYVLVSDSGNSRIQKFGTNGVYIAQYAFARNNFGLDGTNFWSVSNNYIQKFDFAMTQLAQWFVGAPAADVAVDAYGRGFVISNSVSIKIMDLASGSTLGSFGKSGTNADELTSAREILLDSQTNVYVLELGGGTSTRIQKFSWSSKTVTTTTVTTNISQ